MTQHSTTQHNSGTSDHLMTLGLALSLCSVCSCLLLPRSWTQPPSSPPQYGPCLGLLKTTHPLACYFLEVLVYLISSKKHICSYYHVPYWSNCITNINFYILEGTLLLPHFLNEFVLTCGSSCSQTQHVASSLGTWCGQSQHYQCPVNGFVRAG